MRNPLRCLKALRPASSYRLGSGRSPATLEAENRSISVQKSSFLVNNQLTTPTIR
jgi:hypothetical protein